MVVMDAKLSDQSKAKLSRATLRSVASSIDSRSELQLKVDGKKAKSSQRVKSASGSRKSSIASSSAKSKHN